MILTKPAPMRVHLVQTPQKVVSSTKIIQDFLFFGIK